MDSPPAARSRRDLKLIKALTCTMFFTFAMTTDAVGSIIPTLLEEFALSLRAASAFHYVPMIAIAAGALALGFLADRLGRKSTIVLGLAIYGVGCLLFAFGSGFGFFVVLLGVGGIGVSVFKIGALALIGDISRSTREHTTFMNTVEGFFAVGAIVGPAIVATLLAAGLSWKYLYVIAAVICAVLIVAAARARYPSTGAQNGGASFVRTLSKMRDAHALGFSTLIMLYVAVEVAVYVWMPTYLQGYAGPTAWLAAYALTIFFVLRAAGRFLGAWFLRKLSWSTVLVVFAAAIVVCFAGSLYGGPDHAVYLLPLSGLFMSVIYPTLNSKGISCFPRSEHGAVAGVILFFTAFAAAVGPLAMGAVSDALGDIKYGFVLATGFAALLFAGLLVNRVFDPAGARLASRDDSDYAPAH
ncbi:MAG TPA: MFS transporter [Gammaproteobacteria bacterium]|nr:MFS transporter [Gammaproteobacteria bacterium]